MKIEKLRREVRELVYLVYIGIENSRKRVDLFEVINRSSRKQVYGIYRLFKKKDARIRRNIANTLNESQMLLMRQILQHATQHAQK